MHYGLPPRVLWDARQYSSRSWCHKCIVVIFKSPSQVKGKELIWPHSSSQIQELEASPWPSSSIVRHCIPFPNGKSIFPEEEQVFAFTILPPCMLVRVKGNTIEDQRYRAHVSRNHLLTETRQDDTTSYLTCGIGNVFPTLAVESRLRRSCHSVNVSGCYQPLHVASGFVMPFIESNPHQ